MASQAEAPGGSAPTGTGDTGPAQPPSGAGALPWLQGLACGAMAMAQPALAAVLAGLLAPAILALVLDRGELALKVTHDTTRPLTLTAGDARITDLGTEFNVRRDDGAVAVTVREGEVRKPIL